MLRVAIAAALPSIRAGLRALLEAAGDSEVVGMFGRPGDDRVLDPDAAAGAADVVADVLVIDPSPRFDLRDVGELKLFGAGDGGPGVVLLGPAAGDERLPAELAGRAWAYLPRDASGDQLVAAVRAVGQGLVAIDPQVGGHLLARDEGARTTPEAGGGDELTPREREVLDLVAQGLANKMIARRLGISEHTVKFHVAAILAKLGAGSRTEAAHLGARRGLVAL
jgi:DNA-binding NarL/FixJ family response regulator